MKNRYDLIIVGAGPSSIFCAYELLHNGYRKKILIIEKGKRVEERKCPMKIAGKCLKCSPVCNIIGGFSGAGAFSDGKLLSYHLSSYNKDDENVYIGGKDDSFIKKNYSKEKIFKTMKYVDSLYVKFGGESKVEGLTNNEFINNLKEKCVNNNIELIDVPVRHLGTEKSHELFKNIEAYLEDKIDIYYETSVEDLLIEKNKIQGVKTNRGEFYSKKVILAVGVNGSMWLESLCKKYNIKTRNGYIDIGIRYELKDEVMQLVNKNLYEGKFVIKSEKYNDKIRSYCQNPSGYVTPETYDNGCSLVNGHSYKLRKSNNTNLAILVSYKFNSPFNSPNEYGFSIAKKANLLSNGTAIVQRYGDLINGETTTTEKLKINSVKPTYKEAFPYDLSYVLDYRTVTNILDFIKRIGKIIPGFDDDDNLIYGPEIKFYGNELLLDKKLMTSINGLYSIGTGGGLTIGLMMASVSGILLAQSILKEEKKNEKSYSNV